MHTRARKLERKATWITILVALQALAAAFFIADLAADIMAEGIGAHLLIEALAAFALLAAVVLGALQVRGLIASARRDETAIAAAKGALAELVYLRFEEWALPLPRPMWRCLPSRAATSPKSLRCAAQQPAQSEPSWLGSMPKPGWIHRQA